MTTDDFKAQGNKAFAEGNFALAVELFTKAIEADSTNHVLYSNRSAAYCSLRDYSKALEDANQTIALKGDWPKGYSRKGAALQGLESYQEATEAYKAGLAVDPSNALLKKGLEECEAAAASNPMGALGNLFGPDVWSKLASNPKTSSYLAQPDFVSKIQAIQANPSAMNQYMNDPRVMTTIMALMGIDANVATSAEEAARAMDEADPSKCPIPQAARESAKAPEPAPPAEPIQELSEEELAQQKARNDSDAQKALGNAAYKKKNFEEALGFYQKAWDLDQTNVAVLTNKAAVLFEMENFEDCIKACDEAVEVGRSQFADFKLMARALGRAGNAYLKLNDTEMAIKYFEKSLSEHRTPEILAKLRETEKLKKEMDREAYRDPALSDKAREEGNVLFKSHDYAGAVKHYSEAIKRNDMDARNYTNRAACYVKLMALSEADKDCDQAMKLDPSFVKGYIRKAAVCVAKRDFMKAMDWCREATVKDVDGKSKTEIEQTMAKCYAGLNEVQNGANREETLKRAQEDPEVQSILADPVMQTILKQMQENPAAARDHLKNPMIANKINKLINAGIISVR